MPPMIAKKDPMMTIILLNRFRKAHSSTCSY